MNETKMGLVTLSYELSTVQFQIKCVSVFSCFENDDGEEGYKNCFLYCIA